MELRASAALLRDVGELYEVEQRVAHRRGDLAELEELRLDLRRRLRGRISPGFWRVGEFLVSRTEVEPAPSVDLNAAVEAGVVDRAALTPFERERTPYEVWKVKRRRKARSSRKAREAA